MKKILSVLCLLVVTIMLTACGKNIVGKYTAIEITENGQTISAETLKAYGLTYELEVRDDKTAYLTLAGEGVDLTYDDKVFTGKNADTGEMESISYTFDGSKITMEVDGGKIVFKK